MSADWHKRHRMAKGATAEERLSRVTEWAEGTEKSFSPRRSRRSRRNEAEKNRRLIEPIPKTTATECA